MVKSIQILLFLAENHVKCMISHGFLSPLEPFFFWSALPRSATSVLPHLPSAFRAFQERQRLRPTGGLGTGADGGRKVDLVQLDPISWRFLGTPSGIQKTMENGNDTLW